MHPLPDERYVTHSPLRIAILPLPGHTFYRAETEFLMFRQFARDVRGMFGAYCYVLMPEPAKKQLRQEPGMRIIFEHPFGCFHDEMISTPTTFLQLFNPRDGKYPVDLVITSRGASGAVLQRCLRDYREDMVPLVISEPFDDVIPLVLDESMPADFGWKANPSIHWSEITSRVVSYATAAMTIFDTEREKLVALNGARRVLSAQAIKELEGRMHVNPYGFSADFVDECVNGIKRSDKFAVLMAHRHNIDKRWDRILGIYNDFFAFGRDIRIIITAPKLENVSALQIVQSNQAIETHFECEQPEFLRYAAECHVTLWMSKVEGFTVGLAQQLYLGLICVLPRVDWVKEILQETYDDYPFLFTRNKEAKGHLKWIFENYDEAKAKVAWVPGWIKERYDTKVCTRQVYGLMNKNLVNARPPCRLWTKSNLLLFLEAVKTMPDEFGFQEIVDRVVSMSQQLYLKMRDPRRGKASRWSLWKWLKGPGGFIDTCKQELPVFKRDPHARASAFSSMEGFEEREASVCGKCAGHGRLGKNIDYGVCPDCNGKGKTS